MRRLLAALVALAAAAPLPALDWSARTFTATIKPLARTHEVVFTFTNSSAQTVRILNVQSNCDCLEARTDATDYAPGATGRLRAVFTVGDRIGPYLRTISVSASDAAEPTVLNVQIEVPPAVLVSPQELHWPVAGEPTLRVVELRVADGVKIDLTEVLASAPGFKGTLSTVAPGRLYRLSVQPEVTGAARSAALRVRGRAEDGTVVVASAYAHIR